MDIQRFFYPAPYVGDIDRTIERLRPFFYIGVGVGPKKQMEKKSGVEPESRHDIDNYVTTIGLYDETRVAPPKNSFRILKPDTKIVRELAQNLPPGATDSLFWSIYGEMCLREPDKYGYFGVVPLVAQMQEKTRIIAWIQDDIKRFQNAFTNHRVTKARVQEIMTTLLTGVADNLHCLLAYAAYYGVSVVIRYSRNHTYCEFTMENAKGGVVMLEWCGGSGARKWRIATPPFNEELDAVKMRHYLGEGGSALGSLADYKKDELVKMAGLLGIVNDGLGRKELYDKINIACYIIV